MLRLVLPALLLASFSTADRLPSTLGYLYYSHPQTYTDALATCFGLGVSPRSRTHLRVHAPVPSPILCSAAALPAIMLLLAPVQYCLRSLPCLWISSIYK